MESTTNNNLNTSICCNYHIKHTILTKKSSTFMHCIESKNWFDPQCAKVGESVNLIKNS